MTLKKGDYVLAIRGAGGQLCAMKCTKPKNGKLVVPVTLADGYRGGMTLQSPKAATDRIMTAHTADGYRAALRTPVFEFGGLNLDCWGLGVYGGALFAGGGFTVAGGDPCHYGATWDGEIWKAFSWFNATVLVFHPHGDDLIIGGMFTGAGEIGANRIVRWDGSVMSAVGEPYEEDGLNNTCWALTTYNGALIAGGDFTTAGGKITPYVAQWDGAWSKVGSTQTFKEGCYALAVYDGDLIAGGVYYMGSSVGGIYRWNGTAWSVLGRTNAMCRSFLVHDGKLFVGGTFTAVGTAYPPSTAASRIAELDGSTWKALGSGLNNSCYALTVYNGKLIAGGYFTTAGGSSAKYIAEWDGSTWKPLGLGLGGPCLTLAVYDGLLYAGGQFTTAGGNPAYNIAAWDGNEWFGGPS